MKTFTILVPFVLLLVLATAGAAAAETILVFDFDTQGGDPAVVRVMRALVVAELNARGAQVATADGQVCFTEGCARQALGAQAVDAVVVGQVFVLGGTTILKVGVVRADGTMWHDITLTDLGEMNRVAPRLARAIIERIPYELTPTVETVTTPEQDRYLRQRGDFSWGAAVGGTFPVGGSYAGNRSMYQVTFLARYETEHFGFELETGTYFDGFGGDRSSVNEFPIDFSVLYFFSPGDIAPFVGAGGGLHHLGVETEHGTGNGKEYDLWVPAAVVSGGLEFLRTHQFHMIVRGGYRSSFARLGGAWAHGPYFSMGFFF